MAELDKNFFTSSVDSTPVEIDMLDFSYVEHCDDWKKLFSILQILRSGKEGHFPELCKAAEDKMLQVMPEKEKRKYIALNSVASADEIAQVSIELQKWQQLTHSVDEQLKSRDINAIRVSKDIEGSTDNPLAFLSKNQRDKIFDARKTLKVEEMSLFQKERKAEMERRKGNESFKANEHEASVRFYTNSIALNPSNDSVWANRAIAYIKLKLFDLAEQDCDACLHLQSQNVKAYARRGFARFSQGKYKSAAMDYLAAINLDPVNEEYPKFLEKSKEMYKSVEGKELVITSDPSAVDVTKSSIADTSCSSLKMADAPLRVVHKTVLISSHWSIIDCQTVSTLADLIVPSETMSELKRGKLMASNEGEISTRIEETVDEGENAYVKIPISIADDEEEEEDDADANNQTGENTKFVRIHISDDSDGEESEYEGMRSNGLSELEHAAGLNVDMKIEEKAVALKNFGNSLMLRSDWATSIAAYTLSLQYQHAITTLNNRCQARLSSGDFSGAVLDANSVLKEEPHNIKALYRRAKARFEMQLFDNCLNDLKIILELEPTNAPALAMKQTIEATYQKLEADRCKVEGNNAFQEGEVSKAISLYNHALELDPSNSSIYCNRALAHLALGHLEDAIADCDVVIDQCKDDKGLLKKAHQRRSEARWRLANKDELLPIDQKLSFLQYALEDISKAEAFSVTIDKNIAALSQNIRQNIESIQAQQEKVSLSSATDAIVPSSQHTPAKTNSKSNPSTAEKATKTPGSEQKLKLELPPGPAKTLYEFERIWRSFSSRNDLRLEYLRLFKALHFKKVFKAAISDDLLSSLFSTLLTLTYSEVNEKDISLSMKVLESLQQMNSFALTIRMLPQETLQQLRELFSTLHQVAALEDKTKISQLRSAYNI